MKNKILILLSLFVLVFSPNLVLSDCTDFSRATSSYPLDGRTIIFYGQYAPIAQVVLLTCSVNASSNIRLLKNYMCDSDSLIVDGKKCAIMTLNSATGGSLDLGK
jgi:hypothetical protein